MAKKSSAAGRRGAYHHGDLGNALIEAALERVERDGVSALTLRAVARDAGVSHMAPYNHFEDRAALVAAVAARGFRRLGEWVEARTARFPDRPARQLQEAGIAYVAFAVANPHLFRLMFSPELADKDKHPELAEASGRSFAGLSEASRSGTGATVQPGAGMVPYAAWSLVHGLAVLLLDGQMGPTPGVEEAERMAREATDLVWVGFANLRPEPAPVTGAGETDT